jgi:hypothetical protein
VSTTDYYDESTADRNLEQWNQRGEYFIQLLHNAADGYCVHKSVSSVGVLIVAFGDTQFTSMSLLARINKYNEYKN